MKVKMCTTKSQEHIQVCERGLLRELKQDDDDENGNCLMKVNALSVVSNGEQTHDWHRPAPDGHRRTPALARAN